MEKQFRGRPIVVELFSGCGGMSLGFEQAGFHLGAAVEIDPVHAAVHHFNFPYTCTMARSVIGLSGSGIRKQAGLENSEISVLTGGAPCQGFSLIGKRALDDPRNILVSEFVRLARELNPRCVVFENVKGLTVGRHKKFLEELIQSLEELGFNIQRPPRVLNAAHYGVPQKRERLFLLGTKTSEPIVYPQVQTSWDNQEGFLFPVVNTPTCAEAIGDLPDIDSIPELLHSDEIEFTPPAKVSNYAKEMRCQSATHWHFGYHRKWDQKKITSSVRTKHTDISKRRFSETSHGDVEPISRFFKLHPQGLCNTLRAGTDSARGAFTSPRPIHYRYARCISVREMARLQGFPDWFRFHQTKWHGGRQIGNSVPPPLARAVATEVMKSLGIKPKRSLRCLPLGDPSLLRMDMSQASAYWGVNVPIKKRDRKSGAKKRKQMDIERERLARAK